MVRMRHGMRSHDPRQRDFVLFSLPDSFTRNGSERREQETRREVAEWSLVSGSRIEVNTGMQEEEDDGVADASSSFRCIFSVSACVSLYLSFSSSLMLLNPRQTRLTSGSSYTLKGNGIFLFEGYLEGDMEIQSGRSIILSSPDFDLHPCNHFMSSDGDIKEEGERVKCRPPREKR